MSKGTAYSVPDFERGGPILKYTVVDDSVVDVRPVAYVHPDPGYRLCWAIIKARCTT